MEVLGNQDPLSLIAAELEEKQKQQILLDKQKQQELFELKRQHDLKRLEAEEKRLESITKIHSQHPNISINSNNFDIEIKDVNSQNKQKWMNHFCVVNFDLEIGQILDYCYPSFKFKDDESTNLCFLSFPDSNSHLQGDIIYTFKLKHVEDSNGQVSYQYGYVFFRQEKDDTISRGYLQKSVVLLSDEPFVGLFKKVIEIVGPLFFDYGNTLLEVAYQNIQAWPELKLGQTYELPILGYILTFHVPHTRGTPHIIDPMVNKLAATAQQSALNSEMKLVSNLKSIDLYQCFKSFSNKLWMLWELVLLGHPILVISPNPPLCSDSVLALVSLISPLQLCADYRPYFTIHDTDFNHYISYNNNTENPIPPTILGVTNPFFLKAFSHWPNILTIGTVTQRPSNGASANNGGTKKSRSSSGSSVSSTTSIGLGISRDLLSKYVLDNKEKLLSEYKPIISADKTMLKKIQESNDDQLNNELLRLHFLQLTLKFLIPLERYFSSLLPLAKTISIFQRPPRLKNFDKQEFLDKLSEYTEKYIVDNKSKEIELYKQFLESVNFKQWLDDKRNEAIRHLNLLYRKAILEADVRSLLKGKSPSIALDLFKRVKDQLILEENLFQTSEEIKLKFKNHLNIILEYIPNNNNNNTNNNSSNSTNTSTTNTATAATTTPIIPKTTD
ncbi:hypothetical protein DLAC_09928 [Tieghemostelium lacteum]|uniref:UDENN domain-containing protein n=1 Tax=Tieghemostelium lacteum TaxID=361077 RepID=A0A151Z5N7_TIELA|nr:hypothetical protein DLAC_09928 [Tieghemostelium lacteum]|eukprot:KYQ89269.1 hypothetical protein DLAC_09928 [Tieghemostelium lacteum]